MTSAYKPRFASPLPAAELLPEPFELFPELGLAPLFVPPSFSDLWVVDEGVPWFLASFSSSFRELLGDW
jgi:hypothetical protein